VCGVAEDMPHGMQDLVNVIICGSVSVNFDQEHSVIMPQAHFGTAVATYKAHSCYIY
jgi:hypothetical protein